jgi:hypothetical protein
MAEQLLMAVAALDMRTSGWRSITGLLLMVVESLDAQNMAQKMTAGLLLAVAAVRDT